MVVVQLPFGFPLLLTIIATVAGETDDTSDEDDDDDDDALNNTGYAADCYLVQIMEPPLMERPPSLLLPLMGRRILAFPHCLSLPCPD